MYKLIPTFIMLTLSLCENVSTLSYENMVASSSEALNLDHASSVVLIYDEYLMGNCHIIYIRSYLTLFNEVFHIYLTKFCMHFRYASTDYRSTNFKNILAEQ